MSLCCSICSKRASRLTYGRCPECYAEDVATGRELALVAEASNNGSDVYEYAPPDTVYASFHRIEPIGELYIVKTDERLWCLKIHYYDGFPCPPRLSFVSPYNHEDDNPIWWPKLKVACDPIKRKIDIPFVAERTAVRGGLERGQLDRYRPKSEEAFLQSKLAQSMTYQGYLEKFWEKKKLLETGTNAEAHSVIKKWLPATYVHLLAQRIVP